MSIDLDWTSLDAELTASVVEFLSNAFTTTARPSFLGEIQVTSFSFGDSEPQLEVLEIRDVYKEFLQAQEDDDDGYGPHGSVHDEPYAATSSGLYDDTDRHRYQGQVHRRQGRTADFELEHDAEYSNARGLRGGQDRDDYWETGSVLSAASLAAHALRQPIKPPLPSSSLFSPGLGINSKSRSYLSSPSIAPASERLHPNGANHANSHRPYHAAGSSYSRNAPHAYNNNSHGPTPSATAGHPASFPGHEPGREQDDLVPTSTPFAPSVQVHLRVSYRGSLTLGLATSLLINYPAPNFMALPLGLTLSSLAFDGVCVVAFEGDRRRVHFSVLDPGPDVSGPSRTVGFVSNGNGIRNGVGAGARAGAGARLLTDAVVESEVGQMDKHVLKNVGKVEKFVLSVVRQTLESELVFP